jgi:type IV pilus assembly protein PilA
MDMIKQRAARRGQGGFTLIELLVAVAILAILAGVAVFAVGSLRDNANVNACKTEKDTFITANSAAATAGGLPSNNLQSSTVTVGGTPSVVSGKYWQMPDTSGGGTGPVVKTGTTLPTGCS